MKFIKSLFKSSICKHEYKLSLLKSPIREALLLECAHCDKFKVELLAKGWGIPFGSKNHH